MADLWTEDDVANLKAAIASGILTVKFAGPPAREITYQSLDAMRALLASMVRSTTGTKRYRRVQWSKGYRRGE